MTTAVRRRERRGDDEPLLTVQGYPIEVWPNMVGDIRDRLAESGASDESTAMAGSVHGSADEAGLIGEFSKHLKPCASA